MRGKVINIGKAASIKERPNRIILDKEGEVITVCVPCVYMIYVKGFRSEGKRERERERIRGLQTNRQVAFNKKNTYRHAH